MPMTLELLDGREEAGSRAVVLSQSLQLEPGAACSVFYWSGRTHCELHGFVATPQVPFGLGPGRLRHPVKSGSQALRWIKHIACTGGEPHHHNHMLHHIISRRVACSTVYFTGASSDGLRISPERAANLISVTSRAAATSSLQKNHIVEDNLIRVREEKGARPTAPSEEILPGTSLRSSIRRDCGPR